MTSKQTQSMSEPPPAVSDGPSAQELSLQEKENVKQALVEVIKNKDDNDLRVVNNVLKLAGVVVLLASGLIAIGVWQGQDMEKIEHFAIILVTAFSPIANTVLTSYFGKNTEDKNKRS